MPIAMTPLEADGFARRVRRFLALPSGGATMLTAVVLASPKVVSDRMLDQCTAPNSRRSDQTAAVARRTATYFTWIREALGDVGLDARLIGRKIGVGYYCDPALADAICAMIVGDAPARD